MWKTLKNEARRETRDEERIEERRIEREMISLSHLVMENMFLKVDGKEKRLWGSVKQNEPQLERKKEKENGMVKNGFHLLPFHDVCRKHFLSCFALLYC
jgi:hypothetical protein